MLIRPPKALAPRNDLPKDPLSAALEHEVLAEKAATYGRLVTKLEKALKALRKFESAHGDSASEARGPARARPNGRASMASRLAGGSRAIRHGPTDHGGNRPKGGKRERAKPVLGLAKDKTRGASRASRGSEQSMTGEDAAHEALLNAAGRALWYVMVQRDLCGFRRHDLFYKELKIPASVRLRMGIARPQ